MNAIPENVGEWRHGADPVKRAVYWLIDFSWRDSETFEELQKLANDLASPGPTGTAGEPSDEALIEAYSTAYDARATVKSDEQSADRYRAACLAGIRAALRAAVAGAAPADVDGAPGRHGFEAASGSVSAAPASPAVREAAAEVIRLAESGDWRDHDGPGTSAWVFPSAVEYLAWEKAVERLEAALAAEGERHG